MKTEEKDPVSHKAEKSITESASAASNTQSARARELRQYVDEAPAGGTYRSAQGLDERAAEDHVTPDDQRPGVAENNEP